MTAYPLAWPPGWRRTENYRRARARFSHYGSELSVADGVSRVLRELQIFGSDKRQTIISTNLALRQDGLPLSNQRNPEDPGVAVYWVRKGERKCMAIDIYDRVADNLGAVAASLDAMRAIARHGGAEILERAFTGFTALPSSIQAQRPWRDVLGVSLTERNPMTVRNSYRARRSLMHPDKGGTADAFREVETAYLEAQRELGFSA